ncbi:MAG: hypothetical protein GF308_03180 [Candidatus Heimdallarchaeota archaeon]|nr:hypothetical protein [Candidatus Heimdallarchaeota archaeon]
MSKNNNLKIILHPDFDKKAVKYTFTTIFEDFLGIETNISLATKKVDKEKDNVFTIYYGPINKELPKYDFVIQANQLWSEKYYGKKLSLPNQPLKSYSGIELPTLINEETIPIIYMGNNNQNPSFDEIRTNKIKTNIDLIASIFFLLTSYQEFVDPHEDKHQRFPATKSLAFQEGFLDRPLVNEYVQLLVHWIKKANPDFQKKPRQFQLFLTHDIDNIEVYTFKKKVKKVLIELLRKKSLKGFFQNLWRTIRSLFIREKNTIKYLIKTSNKYGFTSHFFFLTSGSKQKYDQLRYNIHSSRVKKIIREIEKNNHRVHLHASYNSFLNQDQLQMEKEILEKLVKEKEFGVRWHYLRFKVPDSYSLINSCNFTFDSSLAYAGIDGFRAGTCYPFKPFNLAANKKMNFMEYPLIIMDKTLIGKNYRNLRSKELIVKVFKEIIDKIAFFNGHFVFLMHNASLEDFEFPWRGIYEEILQYCKAKQNKQEEQD